MKTDEAISYYDENMSNRQVAEEAVQDRTMAKLDAERAKKKSATAKEKENAGKSEIAANTEQMVQAHAAADDVEIGGDGTTTLKNAAGGTIGKVNADGSYERNPSETTTSQMVKDADGNLRWSNGKLAGPVPTPNEGVGIPPGGFAAKKQAEMDAASEKLLGRLRQNNPNGYSDDTLLANYAMQHNAKISRPVDKTNVGPRVTIVGGSSYKDGHTKFIRNNPNAVSPQEREQFLGSGNSANSWGDAVRNQQSDVSKRVLSEQKAFQDAADRRDADKKRNIAERRAAFGSLASMSLQGLRGTLSEGPIQKNDPRIVSYTDAQGNEHRILTFSVDKDTIAERNNFRRGLGATGDYGNVFAGIEIGENGRPLLDENGKPIRPKVYADFTPDGTKGKTSDKTLRIFDVPQMERLLGSAYETMGESKEGAKNLVYSMMSGWGTNPSSGGNWHENVARINADAKKYATDENNNIKLMIEKLRKEGKVSEAEMNMTLRVMGMLSNLKGMTGGSVHDENTLAGATETVLKDLKSKGQAASENKDNGVDETIPGYSPEKVAELKRRGFKWDGSKWSK